MEEGDGEGGRIEKGWRREEREKVFNKNNKENKTK